MFHGKVGWGWLLVVVAILIRAATVMSLRTVSLFLGAVSIISSVYFGLHGSAIAWRHGGCRTVEEPGAAERGWTIAGAIVLGFPAVRLVLLLTLFLLAVPSQQKADRH